MKTDRMSDFEWMYKQDAFHFWGGPLHGQVLAIPKGYYPRWYVLECDPVDASLWVAGGDIPEKVPYRKLWYQRTLETLVVFPWGIEPRDCYVFMGDK
jgi:hypothetical protein